MRILRIVFFLSLYSFNEASSSTDVIIEPGLGGLYRIQQWFSLKVIVQNDDQYLKGILSTDFSGMKYELPIDLPTKSRKKVLFYLYPTTPEREVKMTLHSNKSFITDDVSKIEDLDQSTILVGILRGSNLTLRYPFLEGKDFPFRVVNLTPDNLPDKWHGYDTLDIMIMDSLNPALLSPNQKTALKDWLYSGGRLFLYGHYPHPLGDDFYKDVLPVNVLQSATIPETKVNYGNDKDSYIASSEPTLDLTTLKEKCKIIQDLYGNPIIIKSNYGMGEAVYFAIPFSSSLLNELLKDDLIREKLFSPGVKPYQNEKFLIAHNLSEGFRPEEVSLLLSWKYILYFFIIYFGSLIALYIFIFQKNNSFIFNFITLVFFPVFFTAIFGTMFFLFSSYNLKIDNFSILIGSNQIKERILSKTFCILSSQKKKNLEIGLRNTSFGIEPANTEDVQVHGPYILTETEYTTLRNVNLNPLRKSAFFLRGFIESDEFINADISWLEDSIKGSITNTSQCDFRHCMIMTSNSYYELPDLYAQKTIKLNSEQHNGIMDQESLSKHEKQFYDLIKEVLFKSVVRDQYPILLGWSSEPVLSYSLNERYFKNTHTSLLIYFL